MAPIKIAFPFVGDTVGGSHVSAGLLMAALPAQGFEPLAVVHRDGPLIDWLKTRGLPFICADLPYYSSRNSGAVALLKLGPLALRLAGFLRRENFALVHANDGRMITSWMLAAQLVRKPAIAHCRTRWSRSRLAYVALRVADGIIANSNYVRDSLPKDLQQCTTVVANPFELPSVVTGNSRDSMRNLVGGSGPIVAFVGTFQPQKRADVFIHAAAIMRERRSDLRFVLFGRDNGIEKSLRRLCTELGVDVVTTFAGFREDVRELLAGCDVLLAPAVDEGHGRVLVEAMLAGVPVVASASGGHVEIVSTGRTGLLVPADSPDALADSACRLLDDPTNAQAIVESALAYARASFSPAAHAAAVGALYRRVLSSA